MSTNYVHTKTGKVIANAFAGKNVKENGRTLQVELAPHELEQWKNETVHNEEYPEEKYTLGDLVAKHKGPVQMDSAFRQNSIAHDLENHRWFNERPIFQSAAQEARDRARYLVRKSVQVVRP